MTDYQKDWKDALAALVVAVGMGLIIVLTASVLLEPANANCFGTHCDGRTEAERAEAKEKLMGKTPDELKAAARNAVTKQRGNTGFVKCYLTQGRAKQSNVIAFSSVAGATRGPSCQKCLDNRRNYSASWAVTATSHGDTPYILVKRGFEKFVKWCRDMNDRRPPRAFAYCEG
jgi:hypothetical protein